MNENTETHIEASDELSGRYLLFYIGDAIYGISLSLVLEIIDIQHITRLPRVAEYVKGIVNLRGKVVPAIDVRLKFNMPERPYDDKTCIIVLDIHDMHIGLIVDRVLEVVTVEPEQLATPPSVGDLTSRYLSSVSEVGGKVILNIDFDKFFQSDLDTALHL